MKLARAIAVVGLACALAAIEARAAEPAPKDDGPSVVEGKVEKVDRAQGRVTLRDDDGKPHVFKASDETAAALKPGDRIQAKRREAKQ
ncbi:MAG TPA: hypothetical protein VMW35_13420 [Myxococcota bacterium]|jgi:hypothetical protein|nr:hypothetical protein [Myxococcota bacterium]